MARYETVLVTPALAKEWLARNAENNRNPRATKIAQYAADMAAGLWQSDTGATIKFAKDDTLIDGQNRLTAVIQANVAVQMDVAYDLPLSAMVVTDTGATRGAADVLRIGGAHDRMRSSAIVRWVLCWERGNYMRNSGRQFTNPTISEILERFSAQPAEFEGAAARARDCQDQGVGSGAPAGVAAFLFAQIDPDKAHAYFDQFVSGLGFTIDRPNHPILTARNKLARLRVDRVTPQEQLCIHVRAWNAFREDRDLTQIITAKSGELNNKNFPMPR
jgi:hypothetical protein